MAWLMQAQKLSISRNVGNSTKFHETFIQIRCRYKIRRAPPASHSVVSFRYSRNAER